jgi:pyridoxamine 5'-phosphate oxidase
MADTSALLQEALQRFDALWREAREQADWEPDAMSLATVDSSGRPRLRTVLLKEANASGFVFYTNYESRKGRDLETDPRAALCFFWRALRRQIMVEGSVARLSSEASDAYFASRARASQLGAWASAQSQPLASREALQARMDALEAKYAGREVPRPPHWGGFRLAPEMIEFWSPVAGRLNERERYTREEDGPWRVGLINP